MGSSISKVECMWLPGQSGKTRKIQESIKLTKSLSELFDFEEVIHVIICSNNRALVKQTGSRMNKDLYPKKDLPDYDSSSNEEDDSDEESSKSDAKIEGNVFTWLSGNKSNNISTEKLGLSIINDEVNMLICCAHVKRLTYLKNLLTILQKSKAFQKKINIWIDEADASCNLWSKSELNVIEYQKINKITLVSATFDSVIKKYERIKVLPFEKTHPETYHKIQECNLISDDFIADSAIEYIKGIYKKYKDELYKPGIRLFVPGDVKVESHDNIASFLKDQGFAVVVLNGYRKEIVIPQHASISLQPYLGDSDVPEEIGKIITKIYHDSNLSQFPFAITGQMCIGRGITFQNENFLFDYGIIYDIPDKANAYQCGCRMAGNIKNVQGYKQAKIISPTKMIEKMLERENIAVNIGKIVNELNLPDVGKEQLNHAKDPEEYEKKEIPIVLQVTKEFVNELVIKKRKNKEDMLKKLFMEKIPEMYEKIKDYSIKQISTPNTDNSYDKNVIKMAKKAERKEKGYLNFTEEEKKSNIWQAIIDNRENRIILIIYHGSTKSSPVTMRNPFE
jgi:hypothetical protein